MYSKDRKTSCGRGATSARRWGGGSAWAWAWVGGCACPYGRRRRQPGAVKSGFGGPARAGRSPTRGRAGAGGCHEGCAVRGLPGWAGRRRPRGGEVVVPAVPGGLARSGVRCGPPWRRGRDSFLLLLGAPRGSLTRLTDTWRRWPTRVPGKASRQDFPSFELAFPYRGLDQLAVSTLVPGSADGNGRPVRNGDDLHRGCRNGPRPRGAATGGARKGSSSCPPGQGSWRGNYRCAFRGRATYFVGDAAGRRQVVTAGGLWIRRLPATERGRTG